MTKHRIKARAVIEFEYNADLDNYPKPTLESVKATDWDNWQDLSQFVEYLDFLLGEDNHSVKYELEITEAKNNSHD